MLTSQLWGAFFFFFLDFLDNKQMHPVDQSEGLGDTKALLFPPVAGE